MALLSSIFNFLPSSLSFCSAFDTGLFSKVSFSDCKSLYFLFKEFLSFFEESVSLSLTAPNAIILLYNILCLLTKSKTFFVSCSFKSPSLLSTFISSILNPFCISFCLFFNSLASFLLIRISLSNNID